MNRGRRDYWSASRLPRSFSSNSVVRWKRRSCTLQCLHISTPCSALRAIHTHWRRRNVSPSQLSQFSPMQDYKNVPICTNTPEIFNTQELNIQQLHLGSTVYSPSPVEDNICDIRTAAVWKLALPAVQVSVHEKTRQKTLVLRKTTVLVLQKTTQY